MTDLQGNKCKLSDCPAIYKGDSQTTQWQQKRQWIKAAQGCGTLDSFFSQQPKTPNNGPLLVESEQELLSDLEQDPALDFTLSTGFDMADLCATYLETWLDKQGHNMVLDEEDELELHEDLEYPPESAEIESACEWLDVNDEENVEPHNTLLLVDVCLKEAKKLRTPRLIKVITQLSAIAQYHAWTKYPCLSASLAIARRMGKGPYFAQQIRHATLLDNETVVQSVHQYLTSQNLGTIAPHNLCNHINKVIIPALGLMADTSSISERTSLNWLKKLKYLCKNVQKGIFMSTYDNKTLTCVPPKLGPGKKEHVLITQDECIFHPIKKKGNGHSIHVLDFICETIGFLTLSMTQIEEQMKLPLESHLCSFTACHIIYPGKNHNAWWDLKQLVENVKDAIDVFEHTNPRMVAIFVLDCSLAHEGLAPDALNINNINIGPGGKQKSLHDTIIPLSNPPPKPGHLDTCGVPQTLIYPSLHPNEKLAGKPKGMRAVLEERESVWDEYIERLQGRRVVAAEAEGEPDEVESEADNWCCIFKVLSLQEDFATEKPMLQHLIESQGHVCLFLPKFHCKLNPSEMVWGYRKYCESAINESLGFHNASDGKFLTAKILVP
ncbi:uncharacterized protein BJ212DRAFT_1447403 [Suillus subaureus]|uniref:DDE-1 domain-containing protein n=1 Tax=Suillus subaureus TaxID=48587 RepID=A0A9P7E996_9AGAM|nr:uncharacterized protein BJ212DRAFT_1447403 [Suillus subaureus]KAG1815092.1 hypothetical protein BJ212DRAFT_1447403 [Suillus subaureus]